MTDSADERTKVDRTKDPEDPAKDVREEYTGYRDSGPGRTRSSEENAEEETERAARREAELQPGSPGSEGADQDDSGGN